MAVPVISEASSNYPISEASLRSTPEWVAERVLLNTPGGDASPIKVRFQYYLGYLKPAY
jgi:hypothetical protein